MHFSESITPHELIKKISPPPDIVIMEGLKNSAFPKIEIIRKGICEKSVCDENTLICAVSDCIAPDSIACPVFGMNDTGGIIMCVLNYFGIGEYDETYKDDRSSGNGALS